MNAQKGCSGIAAFFLELRCQVGVGGRRHALAFALPHEKNTVYRRRVLDGCGKPRPPPEFDPRIPATCELMYRLRTPVHKKTEKRKRKYSVEAEKLKKEKRKVYRQKKERKFELGHSCRRHYLLSTTLHVSTL